MIERADEALYEAKRGGRDDAKVWSGELVIVG
jgi:PleD family two-component response regulator